ncbi:histidine kinase [Actinorhabdospora filicis]|uniref:Histidine kinase n=1 Tax=Actinorhabdospora filicis TaxID=1785913 RepID=A0A9W6SQN4_9ACTN|nr:sensor histidine kinase [Actinorhabdospora filicis]GLZ78971.1 histidine kinase [Actinorhabdospora filicis]
MTETTPTGTDGSWWARRGRRFRLAGMLIALFFTIYLIDLAQTAVRNNPLGVPAWLIVGLYLVYAVSFVSLPAMAAYSRAPAYRITMFTGVFVLATVLLVLGGMDTVYLFIYPINSLAFAAPLRIALIVDVIVVALLMAAAFVLETSGDAFAQLLIFGSMATITILMGRLVQANRELRAAQEGIAELSARDERARIARDLHDILGHTLTTITLKSSLARRLLEADRPAEAGVEITDVEHLARDTLGEVRATVSGYREASLAAELASARAALRAAGITPELPLAVDGVPEPQRTVFAYAVREGVTNVIRHSHAGRCAVTVSHGRLDVRDNGRGRPAPQGNGLTGLRERVEAIGGVLEAGPAPGGGYTLTVRTTG